MDSVKAEIRPSLKRNKFGGSESSLNTEISRCYTKPLKPSYLRKSAVDDFNRSVYIVTLEETLYISEYHFGDNTIRNFNNFNNYPPLSVHICTNGQQLTENNF